VKARALAVALVVAGPPSVGGQENAPPTGFARLDEIAPTIRQDIRYASPFNFAGRRVPGYEAARCILWRPAAEALARAQAQFVAEGFLLKVYDCYRPTRAVRAFAAWSQAPGEDRLKSVFYPDLDKGRLFALGYIAAYSRHSLGIAVDIGLVRADEPEQPTPTNGGRCDGTFEARTPESSLDFGTAFDCFSELSATFHKRISAPARANRDRLLRVLKSEGFRNYSREWWHFELNRSDAPTMPHDFPVR